ncbi:DUF1800 domain-containing protein [Ideonella sp. YS5]|uniref:DUF1800 domain-containing protein n=1 Tax=Ideonella sp. YS5 TaxID=3453714 RepID=UPI003EEE2D35
MSNDVAAEAEARCESAMAPSIAGVSAAAMLAACGGGQADEQAAEPKSQAERRRDLAAPADYTPYTPEELAAAFAPDGQGQVDAQGAARFLIQASHGPTVSSLAAVRTQGLAAWIESQFAAPRGPRHVDRIFEQRDALGGWSYVGIVHTFGPENSEFMMNEAWRAFMTGPDALRQRVVAALLEIFVITTRVGIIGIGQNQVTAAAYVDMLNDRAFGNFRELLDGIARSSAMGVYLSYRDNLKAEYGPDGKETRVPDENFARELMQLFSIGLYKLNADGSLKLKKGKPQETYTQDDVFNLARVFTGWRVPKPVNGEPDMAEWSKPMVPVAANHSPEEIRFLGKVIAAGTKAETCLKKALDIVFAHENVGPFIGRQLIQRLVTSNPSAGYVGRVSAAFANNGQGVRGDLRAVLRAVLLDPEARAGDVGGGDLPDIRGKVREPMLRLVAVARAMEAGDPGTIVFPIANLSGASTGVGQAPLKSPTVFNFFRPGYAAPQSELGAQGYVAPEFQLLNGPIIAASINKINEFVRVADDYLLIELGHLRGLAPRALVQRVSLILTGASLSMADEEAFTQLVSGVSPLNPKLRIQVALQLVASSAAFVVQAW